MPRLEWYPPIPLPKGTAGGKAEAGAWEEGLCAGATDHPRCCHPHGAPSPSLPGQLTGKWVLLGNSSLALG